MKPGALFLDMASIQPREARDHAARLGALGIAHVDAPVSGGPGGAESGTLAIMAGGKADDFARALPVLAHLGMPSMWARTAAASSPSWPTR
jgi:3-hydroxyisobutyrate dehydrogenase-like beta-hydroxyacid dehydrogenase